MTSSLSEHHLPVGRTARYVTLGGHNGSVKEVWIACHGYGQRAARFAREFESLADNDRMVVVPEALSRFYLESPNATTHRSTRVGASWMTREDRQAEINDYLQYLDTLWKSVRAGTSEGARLVVLGFSQGGATAARWAALGAGSPSLLVLWAASVPRELLAGAALEKLSRMRVVIVAGSDDHLATEALVREEESILSDSGLEVRVLRFAGGHTLDAGVLAALAHENSKLGRSDQTVEESG